MKTLVALALVVAASASFATGKPPHETPHGPPSSTELSAHSSADSHATGIGLGVAHAAGGDSSATATGGAGGSSSSSSAGGNGYGGEARADNSQSQSAQGGAANNEGNNLEVSTHVQRSAPSLGQGGLYNSGCGAGVNGGGSAPVGAGFLGATWTTHDCYLFLLAQRYEAIGMVDTACDILNATKAAKRAFKDLGIAPPPCDIKAPPVAKEVIQQVPIEPSPAPEYVTKQEFNEALKRVVSRTSGK